jgi:hypothetical protein
LLDLWALSVGRVSLFDRLLACILLVTTALL